MNNIQQQQDRPIYGKVDSAEARQNWVALPFSGQQDLRDEEIEAVETLQVSALCKTQGTFPGRKAEGIR